MRCPGQARSATRLQCAGEIDTLFLHGKVPGRFLRSRRLWQRYYIIVPASTGSVPGVGRLNGKVALISLRQFCSMPSATENEVVSPLGNMPR